MMSKGSDAFTAKAQALRMVDGMVGGMVLRQAAVLAYDRVFVLVSALFALGFPLVFLLRRGEPDPDAEIALDGWRTRKKKGPGRPTGPF